MITLEEILRIHDLSIKDYGGSAGVRDLNLIESAVARPFQSFGGDEFYPTIYEKAAALLESVVKNHPFIDGNKRTGFLAAYVLLFKNGFEITAQKEDAYDFVINIASSKILFEEIIEWLRNNSTPL